jgi:hypothetical protein
MSAWHQHVTLLHLTSALEGKRHDLHFLDEEGPQVLRAIQKFNTNLFDPETDTPLRSLHPQRYLYSVFKWTVFLIYFFTFFNYHIIVLG